MAKSRAAAVSERRNQGPGAGPDDRGVTPAVSKSLELGIVVAFVGLLTTVLLAGVIPQYRTAASDELGERVLATAAQEIESAVPPTARTVQSTTTVSFPGTIHGSGYTIHPDGDVLVLDHPREGVGARMRLALGSRVQRVEGRWQSGARTVVAVRTTGAGLVVELENRGSR